MVSRDSQLLIFFCSILSGSLLRMSPSTSSNRRSVSNLQNKEQATESNSSRMMVSRKRNRRYHNASFPYVESMVVGVAI